MLAYVKSDPSNMLLQGVLILFPEHPDLLPLPLKLQSLSVGKCELQEIWRRKTKNTSFHTYFHSPGSKQFTQHCQFWSYQGDTHPCTVVLDLETTQPFPHRNSKNQSLETWKTLSFSEVLLLKIYSGLTIMLIHVRSDPNVKQRKII